MSLTEAAIVREVQALVDGAVALGDQARAAIAKWQGERLELAKLLTSSFRTDEINREIDAAAMAAGVSPRDHLFRWVRDQRANRDRAIAAAWLLLSALGELSG